MKSIVKKILFLVCCLMCSPAICNVFSTAGHQKSNGLNIEIYYPANWTHEEGIRPHIVQKFTDKNDNDCMLIVNDTGKTLSVKQWGNEFKYMTVADYREILKDGDVKSVKETQYEGLPGAVVEYELSQERAGIRLYITGLMHIFGYKNSLVLLQCASADLTKQGARKKFDVARVEFLDFGNGLVLLDKYNSFNTDETAGINTRTIAIYFLTVIFGILVASIALLKQNSQKDKKNIND